MLVKLAQMKAKKLCVEGFSGSDGWLSLMKASNNIVAKMLSGESRAANLKVVNDWVTELPRVLEGFKEEDIYNTDETGLFFKACTNKTLVLLDDDGHGGKVSKDRVTLLLTCS